jgi:hypothetical protein
MFIEESVLAIRKRNLFDPRSTELYPLSRSKLEDFMRCPRCFYIDRRLGVSPPSSPPFNINSAVDHLLKKEFDHYRRIGAPHPYMAKTGFDLIPFADERLDGWRDNFRGVRTQHKESGFEVFGAIDDLWYRPDADEVIVVDYKATSKDGQINLDSDWQISYKRQMELYQWLLMRHGLPVSNLGYFVYCNGRRGEDGFYGAVKFDVNVVPYIGNQDWVEAALQGAKECLRSDRIPESASSCSMCEFLSSLRSVVQY